MSRRRNQVLPAPLAEGQRRLDEWRESGVGRRIPEELWSASAKLASAHGLYRTSRALRLNYDTLRRRVESRGERAGAPVFVDLVPGAGALGTAGQGVAEMIDVEGSTIHIEWSGGAVPDLAAVAAAFYGTRP